MVSNPSTASSDFGPAWDAAARVLSVEVAFPPATLSFPTGAAAAATNALELQGIVIT